MLSSVWLKNIVINELSQKDSPLYIAGNGLLKIFNINNIKIALFEPNDNFSFAYSIDKNSAKILDDLNVENVYKFLKTDIKPIIDNNKLYIPLKTEKTRVFGMAILNSTDMPNDMQLNTLKFYSQTLHSEGIGSIIKSFYKSIVDIRNLCIKYTIGSNTIVAVDDINLGIHENEFTLILGPSGCGKTSLLNAIGTMLHPTSGKVLYDGTDITKFSSTEATNYRRDIVGFIFQQYNLIQDLTAKENVKVAAALVDDSYPAEEVLEMVGLKEKINMYPGTLSGGEQQRVCIARALVKKPKLLLCDEPTGALHTDTSIQVLQILKDLIKTHHIPIVMITHNPEFAVLADHYVYMNNGSISDEYWQPFAKNILER